MKYYHFIVFAISRAQERKIIGTSLTSIAEAIDKLIPEHAEEIKLHGCHCAFYSDDGSANGKGSPIDEIDLLCSEWSRAKGCVEKTGRECSQYDSTGTYAVNYYTTDLKNISSKRNIKLNFTS